MEASTGNILLPQDWEDECAPPPEVYFVKSKVWPELEPDSLEQDEYRGSVQLVVDFVPPNVDSRTLTCWLMAGLDDDDPEWVAATVGLGEAQEDLRKATDLLEAIPDQRIPVSPSTHSQLRCALHALSHCPPPTGCQDGGRGSYHQEKASCTRDDPVQ